jgi:hypothetical protein
MTCPMYSAKDPGFKCPLLCIFMADDLLQVTLGFLSTTQCVDCNVLTPKVETVRFRNNTCDLIYVLGLLTGVCRACWLCPADTEHVRACQNGQWADVMLSAVPSHAAHTQPVTPPVTFVISCHVTSPSSTVAGNKTSDSYIFTVASCCSPTHGHICVAVWIYFLLLYKSFTLFFVLWCQQFYFYIKVDVPTAVNIKITDLMWLWPCIVDNMWK